MINRIILVLLIYLLPTANAEEVTKADVIEQFTKELINQYRLKIGADAKDQKVIISQINDNTKSLEPDEVKQIISQFETSLSDITTVLDREQMERVMQEQQLQYSGFVNPQDVQDLGEKYGASHLLFLDISDSKKALSAKEDAIELTGRVTAIEVKTQRKIITNIAKLKFSQHLSSEVYGSNIVRNSFKVLGVATLAASGVYGSIAYYHYERYRESEDPEKVKKLREDSQRNRNVSLIALGASVLSFSAMALVPYEETRVETNQTYEMTLQPIDTNGALMGFIWRH